MTIKKVGPFTGVNNTDEEEALGQRDLREAVNVDLTDRGLLKLRQGFSMLASGNFHSLWSGKNGTYAVKDNTLVRIGSDFSTTAVRTGLAPGRRVTYAEVADKVFYSNGYVNGCIVAGTDRPWGVEVPNPPTATTVSNGPLNAGTYAIKITAVDVYGEEGGASRLVTHTVSQGQGIVLTLPVATNAATSTFNIYVSSMDDDQLYLMASAEPETTVAVAPQHRSFPLETDQMGPMPVGTVLGAANGRVAVASGSAVWFSEPLAYGRTRLTRDYLGFEHEVVDGASVDGGWFVGTEAGVYFVSGRNPETAELVTASMALPVRGTFRNVDAAILGDSDASGKAAVWLSSKGFMVGFADGSVKELTSKRFSAPVGTVGATQLIEKAGLSRLLCTLKSPVDEDNNMALGDRVTAEVIRNGVVIN